MENSDAATTGMDRPEAEADRERTPEEAVAILKERVRLCGRIEPLADPILLEAMEACVRMGRTFDPEFLWSSEREPRATKHLVFRLAWTSGRFDRWERAFEVLCDIARSQEPELLDAYAELASRCIYTAARTIVSGDFTAQDTDPRVEISICVRLARLLVRCFPDALSSAESTQVEGGKKEFARTLRHLLRSNTTPLEATLDALLELGAILPKAWWEDARDAFVRESAFDTKFYVRLCRLGNASSRYDPVGMSVREYARRLTAFAKADAPKHLTMTSPAWRDVLRGARGTDPLPVAEVVSVESLRRWFVEVPTDFDEGRRSLVCVAAKCGPEYVDKIAEAALAAPNYDVVLSLLRSEESDAFRSEILDRLAASLEVSPLDALEGLTSALLSATSNLSHLYYEPRTTFLLSDRFWRTYRRLLLLALGLPDDGDLEGVETFSEQWRRACEALLVGGSGYHPSVEGNLWVLWRDTLSRARCRVDHAPLVAAALSHERPSIGAIAVKFVEDVLRTIFLDEGAPLADRVSALHRLRDRDLSEGEVVDGDLAEYRALFRAALRGDRKTEGHKHYARVNPLRKWLEAHGSSYDADPVLKKRVGGMRRVVEFEGDCAILTSGDAVKKVLRSGDGYLLSARRWVIKCDSEGYEVWARGERDGEPEIAVAGRCVLLWGVGRTTFDVLSSETGKTLDSFGLVERTEEGGEGIVLCRRAMEWRVTGHRYDDSCPGADIPTIDMRFLLADGILDATVSPPGDAISSLVARETRFVPLEFPRDHWKQGNLLGDLAVLSRREAMVEVFDAGTGKRLRRVDDVLSGIGLFGDDDTDVLAWREGDRLHATSLSRGETASAEGPKLAWDRVFDVLGAGDLVLVYELPDFGAGRAKKTGRCVLYRREGAKLVRLSEFSSKSCPEASADRTGFVVVRDRSLVRWDGTGATVLAESLPLREDGKPRVFSGFMFGDRYLIH